MHRSKDETYHLPVLWQEICETLITRPDGVYYDGTLGGGGHAEALLKKLSPRARYLGVDRDEEALAAARKRLAGYDNFEAYKATFEQVADVLARAGVTALDGVLLDLGVSSHQIDVDARGFTFRENAPLDMRMDQSTGTTAAELLNSLTEKELADIFYHYGEERRSRCIARGVVAFRATQPLRSSSDLLPIIDRCVNARFRTKSYARIFQALRIAVNDELNILEQALNSLTEVLRPGARMAVITYHSLEDRIVKHFFQTMENPCTCPPEFPVCMCGKQPVLKRMRPFFRQPASSEIEANVRARSAKLRLAEKI